MSRVAEAYTGVVQEPVRRAAPVYWAIFPVVATHGADSKATIVDSMREPVSMGGNDRSCCGAIEEGALIIALAITEETFAEQPKESGISTLTAAHFSCCIPVASDLVLAFSQSALE